MDPNAFFASSFQLSQAILAQSYHCSREDLAFLVKNGGVVNIVNFDWVCDENKLLNKKLAKAEAQKTTQQGATPEK
ncbi:hypothetical protein BKA56DRAFT_681186 [Ilyonectria sp. MPI-CAGE-AT-0026]|nr:hypothetical protein BKA56DRAFT_681186 [Ilyonectria sp. MPI-CAGE-AT-0026]